MSTKTTPEKPSLCYQCSKCSSGCPVVDEMDISPHQVMHYLSLGMEEKVLNSKTIWICAGCFTCAIRCPNDIDITTVMDTMRKKAIDKGIKGPLQDVYKFHTSFINSFKGTGRVHEVRMMAENNMRTGKPFNNVMLAPKMLLKGRLHILPPKSIRGFKNFMKRIWNRKK